MLLLKPSLIFSLLLTLSPITSFASENPKVAFTSAELNQLKGHYATVFGYIVVHIHKGHGVTKVNGKRFYLIKRADGHIYPVYKLLGFIPLEQDDDSFTLEQKDGHQIVKVHGISDSGKPYHEVVGEKFTPVEPTAIWRERIGTYKVVASTEKGANKTSEAKQKKHSLKQVTLLEKNNLLFAKLDDSPAFPVLPLSNTHVYLPGVRNGENTIRISIQGKVLSISTDKKVLTLEKVENEDTHL